MNRKLLTLVIVRQNDNILLGMKKRGFGAGRWNGFGGKVQEGESIAEAAKRETAEECELKVTAIEEVGVLDFEFIGGTEILEVHIFKAAEWSGEPRETEEMRPKWFDIRNIPYEEMWADDRYWLPLFLDGKKFSGRFLFDDKNAILEQELRTRAS